MLAVHVFKTGTGLRCIMGEQGEGHGITHRLDVLGFNCPVPVAKTREALEELLAGNVLEVLADDPKRCTICPCSSAVDLTISWK